ncbi:MAG: hypothetical protein CVT92_02530 [Bacteroidetes bacterium HGW-Bacteroidetes-1]|jgi:F0F1-type ATP synthase membrane subunit b/b'|nr:MAG: hypothetical protein CVT92_02530 [Bacteroidetes bacterium HGW-Bacteroidetes-1]
MKKEFLEVQWFEQMRLDCLEESGNKKYIISGPFTRCDWPNGNNRIYPREVMQKAIEALRPKVEAGRVRMMVDHPAWEASMRSVGAIVLEISDVDAAGYAYYKAQIIDTAAGKDLKAIVDAGGKLGVSTRGYGAAAYDQEFPPHAGKFDVIQPGFDLKTFDFVDDPSVSDTEAYCQIESNRRSNPMKTIDELKSAYPELMESFKATVIESEVKKAVDEATAQAETVKTALVAEKDVLAETNKKLSETVKSLTESIKTVCPELFTVVEESKLVEEAKAGNEELNTKLTEAQAEVVRLKEEIQGIKANAAKEARDAQIKQLEATHPNVFKMKAFEGIFQNCLTIDEVNTVFEKNFELYKQIKSEANEPAPAKSVVEGTKTEAAPETGGLTESQFADYTARNRHRKRDGLEPLSIEYYKANFAKN